jgi:hypothetical protein
MKKVIEINITPEQEADVKLFDKVVNGAVLFRYKWSVLWAFSDVCHIISIRNTMEKYSEKYEPEEQADKVPQIGRTTLEYITPFIKTDKVLGICKKRNNPFVIVLRSGLYIELAPRMSDNYEVEAEVKA